MNNKIKIVEFKLILNPMESWQNEDIMITNKSDKIMTYKVRQKVFLPYVVTR